MTPDDLNPKKHPICKEIEGNLHKLCVAVNQLTELYGKELIVNSGYRTADEQLAINPKNPNSAHCAGQAVDIKDEDHGLYAWCADNLFVLSSLGLYMEDGRYTRAWTHLQIRVTKSGKLVFIP